MSAPREVAIDRVTLRVSDVERSAELYAGLVGLRVTELDSAHALLADPAGPAVLELIAAVQPGRAPIAATGLYHTAFLYPGRAGLGAALRRTSAGAYDFVGAADHGVSEALYLEDPDGLGIELYRDRPRSEWPMAGERVAMFTRPLDLDPIAAEAGEGSAEKSAAGIRIGHVHLRVADLESARSFWIDRVGLEPMAELPGAIFMAADGYHHHIGANTWQSAGAAPALRSGPGLEAISFSAGSAQATELETPEGIAITIDDAVIADRS